MSTSGGDGSNSAFGCVGCALIVPAIFVLLGISTGSAGTVVVAVVVGAILAFVAHAFATAPSHPESSSDDEQGDAGDSSAPSVGKPRGRSITPWVRASKMQKTVGEFYRQAGYEALAKQLSIPKDGERATIDETAHIGLDRGNRHARHGTAVTIWVEDQHLGFLPDDVVGDYLDILTEIDSAGQHLAADARIYLAYNLRKRAWSPSMVVRLPAPDQVLPLNGLPPRDGEVIPDGPSIQVTGEKHHQDVLAPLADPMEKAHYAATLQWVTEQRARSAVDTIEVAINGERIGTLTATSAAKVGPLVDLIESAERVPYARAILTSTEKGVEVALRVTRADEAPASWLRMLNKRAARDQQDRDAENGGA